MADEIVFVVNPAGWALAFQSWEGSPVGTWMNKKLQETRLAAQMEAPGPGKVPRNRTGINYSHGILERSILARQDRATTARDLEGHVTALPTYSLMVHEGTKPHIIVPKSPAGMLKFRSKIGTIVYTNKVNHPGTAANPFLVRALKRVM